MSKQAARKAAQRAVKAERCEMCGATDGKLQRHHTDYSNYTDVIVLCTKCHAIVHGRVRQMAKCWVCGKDFYPSHSKRGHRICSPECGAIYGRICAMKYWDDVRTRRNAGTELQQA